MAQPLTRAPNVSKWHFYDLPRLEEKGRYQPKADIARLPSKLVYEYTPFDLRSDLTHFEFNHSHEHIELKFAEIFSFMIFFYRTHLGLDTSEFIDEGQYQRILQLVRTRAELMGRAKAYIAGRDDGTVWMCPACNEDTFLVDETQCCFCHHKEEVVECPSCGCENFDSDLINITDLFDYSEGEGRMELHDDFGMEDCACRECISDIKEKIENRRRSQYDEDMAMESYYASRRS